LTSGRARNITQQLIVWAGKQNPQTKLRKINDNKKARGGGATRSRRHHRQRHDKRSMMVLPAGASSWLIEVMMLNKITPRVLATQSSKNW
jgi:hypothetical protein